MNICRIYKVPEAEHLGAAQDHLYEASYLHKHRSGKGSHEERYDTIGAYSKNCDGLGCEKHKLVLCKQLQSAESSSRGYGQ